MWAALESYRDVLINGLDLVSFLLVTPELLRYVEPLIKNLIFYLVPMFGVVFLTIFNIAVRMAPDVQTSAPVGTAIIAGGFLLLWLFLIYLPKRLLPLWDRWGLQISERISTYSFQFGVGLFLVSRIIAFAAALHAAHTAS